VKKLYRAGLETVNFKTASDQARQLINSWVEKQTEGKLREEFIIYFLVTTLPEQLLERPFFPSPLMDISCGN